MNKQELDKKAKSILKSKWPREIRNNKVLATTDDLSVILGLDSLRDVQKRFGVWDIYTVEVVSRDKDGYLLRFHNGQEVKMKWEKQKGESNGIL